MDRETEWKVTLIPDLVSTEKLFFVTEDTWGPVLAMCHVHVKLTGASLAVGTSPNQIQSFPKVLLLHM